jgi:hypothetical protein
MSDDEARKLEYKRMFESRRLTEPGLERGGDELERGGDELERGGDELERGGDELERGGDELERGGLSRDSPNQVAMDIFRSAANLGGHLVVAFVAPIGASRSRFRRRRGGRVASPASEAAKAKAVVAGLIGQVTQRRLAVSLAHQVPAPSAPTTPAESTRPNWDRPKV